jgi:hypothetical protein
VTTEPPQPTAPPYTSETRDAQVTEQWDVPSRTYRRWENGVLTLERPFTDAENASADEQLADDARRATLADLQARARAAITADATYLDAVVAGSVTTAQALQQVAALTRQVIGLIRLVVAGDLLDSVAGDDDPPADPAGT